MNSEEPKCGDDCKLVEMLVKKTAKEQTIENAAAAVLTGNISQRAAAKRFKVNRDTLNRKLKEIGTVAEIGHVATQSESALAKPKVADKTERDQWRSDHKAGLSSRKIAEKYGRSRLSVTKEIKRREEAEVQLEPTPTPEPTPSVPSSGHSTLREDIQVTPTGELNDHMKALVKRESKSSKDRLKIVAALKEIKKPLEMTMKAASKEFRFGRGIVYQDVMAAERQLAKDGNPGIRETLEEVVREAELVRKFATESLRLLQLDRGEA